MMARRGSVDSVVDAAIQNLANRRLSMLGGTSHAAMNANAMNNSMGSAGGMGIPPLGVGPSMMGSGIGMVGMQSHGIKNMNNTVGMNISSNGTLSMSSKMNQFLMNGLGLNSMAMGASGTLIVSNTNGTSSKHSGAISNNPVNSEMSAGGNPLHQKQLEDQRFELQRRQKQLELQRQQLLTAMKERKVAMQKMQQTIQQGGLQQQQQAERRHSFFGGGLGGLGTPLPAVTTSYFEYERSNPAGMSGSTEMRSHFLCKFCSKAYSNRDELLACENACRAKLENNLLRRGLRDKRRGSLDLLGDIATQEVESAIGFNNTNSNVESAHNVMGGRHVPKQFNGTSFSTLMDAQSNGNFSIIKEPIPLGLPGDKDWLTPLHCFVRLHCVEVFTATKNDVAIPTKGKRKPIQIGQVGIRCPHCHNPAARLMSRERGSVYYPTRYVILLFAMGPNYFYPLHPPLIYTLLCQLKLMLLLSSYPYHPFFMIMKCLFHL